MALDNTHFYLMHPVADSACAQFLVYTTADDAAATVEADGYFDSMVDRFTTNGDVILCVMSDATKLYKVTKTTGDIALSTGQAIG